MPSQKKKRGRDATGRKSGALAELDEEGVKEYNRIAKQRSRKQPTQRTVQKMSYLRDRLHLTDHQNWALGQLEDHH